MSSPFKADNESYKRIGPDVLTVGALAVKPHQCPQLRIVGRLSGHQGLGQDGGDVMARNWRRSIIS